MARGSDRRTSGLRASVLGGVALEVDGRPIAVRGPRRRLLVGLLLAESPRPLSVQRLIDALHGGPTDSSDPANAVHAHLTRLRRLLDPSGARGRQWVRSGPDGYALHPDTFDLWDYEWLVQQSQHMSVSRPRDALAMASRALEMWATPWSEVSCAPALAESVRRAELRHHSLEERWAALVVDLGLGSEHADELLSLARDEPTREQRWSLAMRALVQSGRQGEALAVYDEARRTLAEQLGIDPGEDLRSTQQAVLRQDPRLGRPTRRVVVAAPGGGDPFVGRLDELSTLDGLVSRSRVVSVVGLGGLGKSRLVTEWLASRGRGAGAHWVDLRGARHGGVLKRVATELSLSLDEDTDEHVLEVVRSALRAGSALVVLDNADLVGPDVAEVTARLLSSVPGLTVIVTSRQPLGLTEERVLTLTPLPLPASGESLEGTAAELAFDRLGSEASEAAAREVAEQAGGLPVAIEMVAARRRAALGRAEPGPRPPIEVGESEGPDPVTRAVDEAVLFLSAEADDLFRHSVSLPGGMSTGLAEALAGEDVAGRGQPAHARAARRARALRELVSGSLLVTVTTDQGVRYRALQPVVDARRVWISEDDEAATMTAVAEWMQGRMRPTYLEAPDPARLRQVIAEWINLDSVLGWLEQHQPRRLLDLAVTLNDVWDVTGRGAEGHRWVERSLRALEPDEVDDVLHARALVSFHTSRGLAYVAAHGDSVREARRLLVRAGAQGSDIWGVVHAQLAVVTGWHGDLAGMEDAIAETNDVARRSRSPWFTGLATELDGMAWLVRGEPARGVAMTLEAAEMFEAIGDIDNAANASYFSCVLGRFAELDDRDQERLLALAEERAGVTGLAKVTALVAGERARFGISRGLTDHAEELAAALALTEQAGNFHHAAVGRRDLGLLLLGAGRAEEAATYLREATRHLVRLDLGACSLAVAGLASLQRGEAAPPRGSPRRRQPSPRCSEARRPDGSAQQPGRSHARLRGCRSPTSISTPWVDWPVGNRPGRPRWPRRSRTSATSSTSSSRCHRVPCSRRTHLPTPGGGPASQAILPTVADTDLTPGPPTGPPRTVGPVSPPRRRPR